MDDRATRVHAEHVRRLHALDPALRLPDLEPDEGHELLVSDDGRAVAIVSPQHTEPDTAPGMWVDADVHRVQVRAAEGADPVALTAMLTRAFDALGERLPTHLVAASRDTVLTGPLLRAGYTPATVLALHRLALTPAEEDPGALDVRVATVDDLETLVAAAVAVQAFDGRVGVLPERPGAAEVFRQETASALREHPGWAWVAESDGAVAGVCEMEPPESAGWVTDWVNPPSEGSTTAYLGMLHVEPGTRGAGVGAALVRAAHARAVESGARQVVLHHSAANPLSVPFWGRAGYRPLLTGWVRFPA